MWIHVSLDPSCEGNITDDNDFLKPKQIVLLDARNLYETRIGMFQTSDVETLNPKIRQYSDLPAWIDKNSDQLQGSHVLMYCTGGIRCEMASAYIRSKGAGFENVYQLFGGIQRYLEQFPDGGFFRGKNFVFDHRISVGSKSADIVGSCILCGSSFDDYSSRCRCTYCRVLVLVCNGCQEKDSAEYVCELCQKHGKKSRMALLLDDGELQTGSSPDFSGSVETELDSAMNSTYIAPSGSLPSNNGSGPRKLRILCLHGFRQNASGFKGRTASLAKKLKSIAEFVFVDAPHELPFILQLHPSEGGHDSMNCSSPCYPPPLQSCKRRFAWLVAPLSNYSEGPDWKMADNPFDPLQYQQQTEGFEESFAYLEAIVTQMGPFDGIMGFSQGAAMAALVCKHQQRMRNSQDFRFAILYSGFSMLSAEEDSGQIRLPSLHVFGSSRGRDRQIECKASKELARLFDEGYSHIIEHDMGHIIPTQSPYIDQMRAFLQQFL